MFCNIFTTIILQNKIWHTIQKIRTVISMIFTYIRHNLVPVNKNTITVLPLATPVEIPRNILKELMSSDDSV